MQSLKCHIVSVYWDDCSKQRVTGFEFNSHHYITVLSRGILDVQAEGNRQGVMGTVRQLSNPRVSDVHGNILFGGPMGFSV